MAREERNSQTLSYIARDEIRRRIVRGHFRPGEPLREINLEKQLGVSRGPVREALRLLIPTGLVEYRQWRGFRVKKYSADDLENLYRLRAILEGMLATTLAEDDLSELVPVLKHKIAAMRQCFRTKDANGYFDANLAFHQDIIDFSKSTPLVDILNNINEMCLPARYALAFEVFPNESAIRCHDAIVDSLQSRDFPRLRTLIEEHILEDLQPVKRAYARSIRPDGGKDATRPGQPMSAGKKAGRSKAS
jgi:DNA-binding GntR family transcriptional regulator